MAKAQSKKAKAITTPAQVIEQAGENGPADTYRFPQKTVSEWLSTRVESHGIYKHENTVRKIQRTDGAGCMLAVTLDRRNRAKH